MSSENHDAAVSRRGFLKTTLAVVAGATATGAGMSWLRREQAGAPVISAITSPAVAPRLENTIQFSQSTTELLDQLIAAHAENMRLQVELNAAQRRVATLEGREPESGPVHAELDEAQRQLGALGGLVALYEQLDAIDLDAALDQGLEVAGDALAELFGRMPLLSDGLNAGEEALAALETDLPFLVAGRQWLAGHLDRLDGFYGAAEQVLTDAIEGLGSFLDMLQSWFEDVLRWLPFGLGRKAVAVMAALTDLLAETPHTVHGLKTNVAGPLDLWLAEADGQKRIEQRLVTPLREKTLKQAQETVAQAATAETAFQALAEPAQQAVIARQAMREIIRRYRDDHGV
jgi:hypothetical protein